MTTTVLNANRGFAMRNTARSILSLGTALALAGCISFGPKPPPMLLNLTPSAQVAAGAVTTGTTSDAIVMAEPEAPVKIQVTRVPVQVDDSSVAYLEDAVWVDKPTRLFRALVAETIRSTSGKVVLDREDQVAGVAPVLRGTLREFGYDARSSSVLVRFDAIRELGNGVIETRRFEASVPGVAPQYAPVGEALNQAANDVAGQVAAWVG